MVIQYDSYLLIHFSAIKLLRFWSHEGIHTEFYGWSKATSDSLYLGVYIYLCVYTHIHTHTYTDTHINQLTYD